MGLFHSRGYGPLVGVFLLLLWLAGLPLVGTLTVDTEVQPILFTPRPVGRITAGSGSDSAWLDRPADAHAPFAGDDGPRGRPILTPRYSGLLPL